MQRLEQAVVAKVKRGATYVRLTKSDACGACKACAFGRKNIVVLQANRECECSVGDRVTVRMPESTIKGSYLLLYLLPLLFLLAGLLAGSPWGEKVMFVCAICALILGFVAVSLLDRLFRRQKKYLPTIVSVSDVSDVKEKENI